MFEFHFYIIFFAFFFILVYFTYRIVTRNKEISASAEFLNLLLSIIKPKKWLIWVFKNPPRTQKSLRASIEFSEMYDVTYHNVNGNVSLTAKPRDTENNTHLVYLHGGAYILGKNGFKGSESFTSNLIDGTGAKVTFIDYPVAPESCFKETLDSLYETYLQLNKLYKNDLFVFVGESAGGGLALSFAQKIIGDLQVRPPKKLILFSPWLDLSMETPEISELMEVDNILSKNILRYAALNYAGSEDLKNPLVSPIYGEFKELGATLMFFGTSELFYADGLRMMKIAETGKYNVSFRFYLEMPHVWVLMPIPEAKTALDEAFSFLLT